MSGGWDRRLPSIPGPNPTESRHADPPSQRGHGQPHCRRRGGRAAGFRRQRTGRERHRRRRVTHRGRDRDGRCFAGTGQRRWRRDRARRPDARGRAALHVEARQWAGRHSLAWVSRRGAGGHRRGSAAHDHVAAKGCQRGIRHRRRGRRRISSETGGAQRRDAGRGARSFLRDAGAAQVSEIRARRGDGGRGRRQAAGVGASRGAICAVGRRRICGDGLGADAHRAGHGR